MNKILITICMVALLVLFIWLFLVHTNQKNCFIKTAKESCGGKVKGWFNDKYPLDELLKRKKSWSCDGQQCLYCFDGEDTKIPTSQEKKE